MNTQEMITQLNEFRQELYQALPNRADALMDLVDALSSNTTARSVVELSLSPLFPRSYNSVYDGINNLFLPTSDGRAEEEHRAFEQSLMRLTSTQLLKPEQRKFWLFGIDVTPLSRPFARALADRTFVHQPNTIRGNKPIAIGHQYSVLVHFPEKEQATAPPWVTPLSMRRVPSEMTPNQVAVEQTAALMEDETLPFHGHLCVEVLDSAYSVAPFLGPVVRYDNLVIVARLRGNRVLYRLPLPPEPNDRRRGHPTWYGQRFDLRDPTTWGEPDETAQTTHTTRRGRTYTVYLEGWHNLLMRGKRDIPMHRYPFTALRIRVTDAKGQSVFKRPMWLTVFGERRHELSLVEAQEAYGQRYDEEHFFRFGKQRLLAAAYQTPDVEHEENWWHIVQLAYVQLWQARSLAEALPRPWERYLPQAETGVVSPATVQRDLERIIRHIGTPARSPKGRGKSPGRAKGWQPERRERQPVIKKGKKSRKKGQKST
jgi:hypothetical protein